jgi:tetratricopeptide (TPR) repeat protein
MSRLVKCHRRSAVLVAVTVILLIGGAAILWGKTRLFPDLIAEAGAAYSRGEWDRTGSLARRRLKAAADDPRALRLAARAAARQDHDRKAIAIYQRIAPGSHDAEDFFLLGRAWIHLGQIDKALPAYEAARERDPDHAETLAALAGLYMRTDRYQAAAEVAQRLAQPPAWEARARVILGTICSETHDSEGAARALQRWSQLDPQGRVIAPTPAATLQKLLARSWLQAGRPAEARTVLETLLRTGPAPDPEAAWLLSRCFLQQRDWKQAAAVLNQQRPPYRSEHPLDLEPAAYVGEARCAGCHPAQAETVRASRHATTFARARDLEGLPLPKDPLPDPGNPQVTHRFRHEGRSLVVETRADQKVWRAVVDYAFGSRDHFTTLVGRDDRGQSFMVRMSYYRSPRGSGWDLATGLPRQPAVEEEYLGKKMFAGDGVRRCLDCHTTNLRSILQEAGPESADHAIGCERCHGPGGHHVAAVAAGFSDLAIVNPSEASPEAVSQICARCHGTHQPDGLDLPRTDPLWLRFESLTLTWSRCYTESDGALGCTTCHDPHRNAETSAARNEAQCLSCHAPDPTTSSAGSSTSTASGRRANPSRGRPDATGTQVSCPVNPTTGCLECHMPRIWVEPTHSFKTDHFIRIQNRPPSESRTSPVHG